MQKGLTKLKILLYKVWMRLKLMLTLPLDRRNYVLYKSFFRRKSDPRSEKSRIVYLCELTPARAGRMARELKRQKGLDIVLLCHTDGYVAEFIEGNFQQVLRYRNEWHLRYLLDKLGPIRLIHAFAPKSFYPEIARNHVNVPFIMDMQDVVVTYHGLTPPYAWARAELIHEKSALSHADAVIGQSLEPRAGFRLYGIENPPRTLYFPLLCDESAFRTPAYSQTQEEVHLVYAGGLAGSHRDRTQFGILQFHSLIESLSAQGIHFHIYPSPSTLAPDYEEYYGIAQKNPFFHMHDPVDNQELTDELSKYHFGILPFFKEDSDLKADKMRYSTSLKLFNFLEAGIPILISEDITYQCWMATRKQSGIAIGKKDVPHLKEIIQQADYQALLRQVASYRQELSLQKRLPRITDLYDTLTQGEL